MWLENLQMRFQSKHLVANTTFTPVKIWNARLIKGYITERPVISIYKMQQKFLWQTDFNQEKKSVRLTSELNYAFDEASIKHFPISNPHPNGIGHMIRFVNCWSMKVNKSFSTYERCNRNKMCVSILFLLLFSSDICHLLLITKPSLIPFTTILIRISSYTVQRQQQLFTMQ